jgi:hypothetical protein
MRTTEMIGRGRPPAATKESGCCPDPWTCDGQKTVTAKTSKVTQAGVVGGHQPSENHPGHVPVLKFSG